MPLHSQVDETRQDDSLEVNPIYVQEVNCDIPRYRLPERGELPRTALQIVRDELILDGNARLNLATFVTTWMEPEAELLMAECAPKNMIDKDEYPQTAELERRCVNILGNLWNAPGADATGCSTTGSSEACMLGGMALLWRWRARRRAAGADVSKPNLVMGSNVQVCWEKFCRYWEVEPRYVPMVPGRLHLRGAEAAAKCDENTIGVVAIMGSTMDGSYEPVLEIRPNTATTSRCTWTGRPAGLSPRSCSQTWSGTSGCRGLLRSTAPGISTVWCIRAWAGSCGATRRRCPMTSSSGSTTSAGRCRRSR
jgi:glutamate decarboxylase